MFYGSVGDLLKSLWFGRYAAAQRYGILLQASHLSLLSRTLRSLAYWLWAVP
jgi:hypothetical protein